MGKIDQFLNLEHPVLWSEKIDPLAVTRGGDATRPTAVSCENSIVRRNIEMHRPVLAFDLIANLLAGRQDHACQPELFPLRSLQVIPDDAAIGAEEFMTGDLHLHRARVNFAQAGII